MVDIAVVRRSETYVADEAVAANRRSALLLIRHLLALQGVTPKHHKEQLSIALWKWTEAEGVGPNAKFNTRYISAGVLHGSSPTRVNHEHVWTRKQLVTSLLSRSWEPEALEEMLVAMGVPCIVTVEEHGRLSGPKLLEGWARYAAVGVPVYDRMHGTWVDTAAGVDPQAHTPASPTPAPQDTRQSLETTIEERAKPARAALLVRLLRTVRIASAVAVPSFTNTGQDSAYFRVHDTLIAEPTRAVAYPHWSGRVDFALDPEDLPGELIQDRRIKVLKKAPYRITCTLTDDSSLALVEDLLVLALERLRGGEAW